MPATSAVGQRSGLPYLVTRLARAGRFTWAGAGLGWPVTGRGRIGRERRTAVAHDHASELFRFGVRIPFRGWWAARPGGRPALHRDHGQHHVLPSAGRLPQRPPPAVPHPEGPPASAGGRGPTPSPGEAVTPPPALLGPVGQERTRRRKLRSPIARNTAAKAHTTG